MTYRTETMCGAVVVINNPPKEDLAEATHSFTGRFENPERNGDQLLLWDDKGKLLTPELTKFPAEAAKGVFDLALEV